LNTHFAPLGIGMATTATFKRGTTFAATIVYTPDAGGPANLLGTGITSDIIDSGGTTYHLDEVTAVDGMSFNLYFPTATSEWSTGTARWDIKFNYAGAIFYSETLRLNIIDEVTH